MVTPRAAIAMSAYNQMRYIICLVVIMLLADSHNMARGIEDRQVYNSEQDHAHALPTPEESARSFRVPHGFRVETVVAEPALRNPIAATWDTAGRLWIAENFTYAERTLKFDLELFDRIIIIDPENPQPRVFYDRLQRLTGLEVGSGGVWAICPPQLLFIPDHNRDDLPDAPPRVVLEGFEIPAENHHNFANGLRWGPDGWLYGRCGASAPGEVYRADRPYDYRVPLRGGIWRYHPVTQQFEALCHGTTNPWGHDWNEHGELFFINTVNGHLWHMIPGAHYRRPHTLNAHHLIYEPLEMHADHWHWDTKEDWTASRSSSGEHDRLGGGHAHVGMMIYLGEQWPAKYSGRLMTINQHGKRVNVDRLVPHGSGYVGRHEPDILLTQDPFFRGIEITYGPKGDVYILDWCDVGECHEHTGVHRNSGRLYKITYSGEKQRLSAFEPIDLRTASVEMLIHVVQDGPEWWSRAARRELWDRAAVGDASDEIQRNVLAAYPAASTLIQRLRLIWTGHGLNPLPVSICRDLIQHPDEMMRAWGLRLLFDRFPLDTPTGVARSEQWALTDISPQQCLEWAAREHSPRVRLVWSSLLQRWPIGHRLDLLKVLATYGEDAQDHNIPSMLWFGIIPIAQEEPERLVEPIMSGHITVLQRWLARRCAELGAIRPHALELLLKKACETNQIDPVLSGLLEGLKGQRKIPEPASWQTFSALAKASKPLLATLVDQAAVVFGDGQALTTLREIILDESNPLDVRQAALASYIAAAPPDLKTLCTQLLKKRFLNTTATRGLVTYNDPSLGTVIAGHYKYFHPTERPQVMEILCSRPTWTRALLDEIARGSIPARDLLPTQARQILTFNDPELTQKLREVWGEVQTTNDQRSQMLARLKEQLLGGGLNAADMKLGRRLFEKHCAHCHRLFGHGGEIGPDLTGSQRHNLDYLLENLIDPSAVVPKDYQVTVMAMHDGRLLQGVIISENEATITLQTAQQKLTLAKEEIEERRRTNLSLMPEGILQQLSQEELVSLIAYLQSPHDVP